jgi:hypothetical protein
MPCTYCFGEATNSELATCPHCTKLIAEAMWLTLAYRWLHSRPEDWIPDVAAFLEYTLRLGADLTQLRTLAAGS